MPTRSQTEPFHQGSLSAEDILGDQVLFTLEITNRRIRAQSKRIESHSGAPRRNREGATWRSRNVGRICPFKPECLATQE